MTERLSNAALSNLAPTVAVPGYDREGISVGIVHLGIGAFHRAHQAVFTDDRLAAGETSWGIIAASLRSPDTRDALQPQDNLYTLAVQNGREESLRIVGSILQTIVAHEHPGDLLDALCRGGVRIVTLTVTEKGYMANVSTGTLLRDHPDIVHDLTNPSVPRTALGFLCEAIARRREGGLQPFTILSCDNLPSNGRTLANVLVEFASLRSPDLAGYIVESVACPSTMVDRIVPATTETDRARIVASLGVDDSWPVVAEPFFQWVIEDRFPSGRPAWEESGVEFVSNVEPHEKMKLRMLNGAHTAIAAIGQVAGFDTVAEAFAQPAIRRFIQAYWNQVSVTLDPNVDSIAYSNRLINRFDNPALRHRTAQISTDASHKIPQRVLEPLKELASTGGAMDTLAFVVAVWMRSCGSSDDRGQPLIVNDPAYRSWSEGRTLGGDPISIVREFLKFETVFDIELRFCAALVPELITAFADIRNLGVIRAIEKRFPLVDS